MKKAFSFAVPALLVCVILTLLTVPAAYALDADAVLAVRAASASIQPGDRIVIVCDAADKAVSVKASGAGLAPADIAEDTAAGRQVIASMDETAAVFEVISAGGNDMYLKCEAGYLTSTETGDGLFCAAEPQDCSKWQFRDGVYLYNTNASTADGEKITRNYFLEYYKGSFTVYGKNANADSVPFALSFYRLGDPVPEEPFYRLPVFDTSDVHGYLADTSGEDDLYLLSFISDKVKDVRGYGMDARKDLAVLLDGGDIFQGNTISNLLEGRSLSAAYQIMGYDAVTIGNHEFDWGIGNTVDADRTMMDPAAEDAAVNDVSVVISNLYLNGEKVSFADDYVILEKTARDDAGQELSVRIGVIGFAGNYASSIMFERFTGAGYSIETDFEAVNALAEQLESGGLCDATILLTHHEAPEIALNLGEDTVIDLVLGGHTHINLTGVTEWGLPYLEPACYGAAYGYAELMFSKDDGGAPVFREVGRLKTVSVKADTSRLTNIPENAEELDPELVALTDAVLASLSDILNQKIGTITESALRYVYLPNSGNRATTAGNWAASIIARIAGADIGFVNNGGLRADFVVADGKDERDITLSDIYTMFPFNNKIYCYELTWEEMLTALEYSMTENGRTLLSQISGIDVYYTDTTVNAIVTSDGLAIYANGVWRDGWKDRTVRVGISEYIATTDRVSYGIHNPFVAWNETDRLISSERIDNEGAFEVLSAEAAANGGHLAIDTSAHYIESAFSGSVEEKAASPDVPQSGQTCLNPFIRSMFLFFCSFFGTRH